MRSRNILLGAVLVLVSGLSAVAQKTEADAAFKAQQWQQAVSLYQQVVTKNAADGEAWYNLGVASLYSNNARTAVNALEHALTLKVNPALTTYNLACAHARLGETERSLDYLDGLSQRAPRIAMLAQNDADLASLRGNPRFQTILQQATNATTPCKNDTPSRQLDFWICDWEVSDTRGNKTGNSHIEAAEDGCAILETWHGAFGVTGRSINTYNPATKKWQQFWVDSSGTVTIYDGVPSEGIMRYSGTQNTRLAPPAMVKMTLSMLPDGKVRQLGEISGDGGVSWRRTYEFLYVKK